jgi:hypothetical protein
LHLARHRRLEQGVERAALPDAVDLFDAVDVDAREVRVFGAQVLLGRMVETTRVGQPSRLAAMGE